LAAAKGTEAVTPQEAFALLDDGDFNQLTTAIEVLGRARYAPAVPKLCEMLDSPTVDVGLIVKVAKALSEIGTPQAMEILKTYLYLETTQLSRHAYEQTTFEKITRTSIVSASAKRALKALDTAEARAILDEWERKRQNR
jgi:HEAT repeat protein